MLKQKTNLHALIGGTMAALLLAGTASAGEHRLGTMSAGVPSARPGVVPARVNAVAAVSSLGAIKSAQYATGGVAMRNRTVGVINISGVTGPVKAAYVYWAYLFTTTPPSTQKLALKRLFPTGTPTTDNVTGTLIGTGADPCWGSSGVAVYRAAVKTSFAVGNGAYQVTLSSDQSALSTGESPWDGNVQFPAAEGVSMVVVGTGSYTVKIYDTLIPSATEWSGTTESYTLNLPATASGASTLWDSIGADGQLGNGVLAESNVAGEPTTINGVAISGVGGANPNSDWDGAAGWPLPQLWDDEGHDITAATPSGTKKLAVGITSGEYGDCLVTVANVVAVE